MIVDGVLVVDLCAPSRSQVLYTLGAIICRCLFQTQPAEPALDVGHASCVDPENRLRSLPIPFREGMTPRAHKSFRRSGVQDLGRCRPIPKALARASHTAARSDKRAFAEGWDSRAREPSRNLRKSPGCPRPEAAPRRSRRPASWEAKEINAPARARPVCDRW